MKYYVGVDLGGTNIVAAVVNESGKILNKSSFKTNLPKEPKILIADIANLIDLTLKKSNININDVENVGIGVPGTVNTKEKVIEYSCNFNYSNVKLAEMLESKIGKDIYIENDANAAALGEFVCGAGIGSETMIVLTLGTGIGGGIILNKKLYRGFNYSGAELGHIVIEQNGRHCNCGRNGCFEAYASATGLSKTAIEVINKYPNSKLWGSYRKTNSISGKALFDLVVSKDPAAIEAWRIFISHLAAGVVNIVNIFQPQVLCIGGGVSQAGELLINPLKEIFDKEDYAKNSKNRCKIVSAKLKNNAGLIGAAMLFKFQ